MPDAPSFDTEEIKTHLKRALSSGAEMQFAYGHAGGYERCGLSIDKRKPGKALAGALKKSSRDISRVSFGTLTVADGELRLAPVKPIKGMVKFLKKRFRDEGLRKYQPVLVDASGQVIDEDSLPDSDEAEIETAPPLAQAPETAQQPDPAQGAADGPDADTVKKMLVTTKSALEKLPPEAQAEALAQWKLAAGQYKSGDLAAAAGALKTLAKLLAAAAASPAASTETQTPTADKEKEAAILKQLSAKLAEAVAELKALPDRAGQAALAPRAKQVQAAIAAKDPKTAVAALKALREGLAAATAETGAAASQTAPLPLDQWNAAKEQVDKGISALQVALREQKHPAMDRIAEYGLGGLSDGTLQTRMMTALMNLKQTPDDARARAALSTVVEEYRVFIASDLVAHCDQNPFGVKLDIAATLGRALDSIDAQLGRG